MFIVLLLLCFQDNSFTCDNGFTRDMILLMVMVSLVTKFPGTQVRRLFYMFIVLLLLCFQDNSFTCDNGFTRDTILLVVMVSLVTKFPGTQVRLFYIFIILLRLCFQVNGLTHHEISRAHNSKNIILCVHCVTAINVFRITASLVITASLIVKFPGMQVRRLLYMFVVLLLLQFQDNSFTHDSSFTCH